MHYKNLSGGLRAIELSLNNAGTVESKMVVLKLYQTN